MFYRNNDEVSLANISNYGSDKLGDWAAMREGRDHPNHPSPRSSGSRPGGSWHL